MKKFEDNGEPFSVFGDYRIVACPKCAKPIDFANFKVSCLHCGYNKDYCTVGGGYKSAPVTAELNNFLEISCCGQSLWALNLEHLDFLERYIESDLRERIPNINKSTASRLPQWMKSRKNRDEVLKGISRLRSKLQEQGYKPRQSQDAD